MRACRLLPPRRRPPELPRRIAICLPPFFRPNPKQFGVRALMMAAENEGNPCTGRASGGKVRMVALMGMPGVAAARPSDLRAPRRCPAP
jgi:hypothetical protein